MKVTRKLADTPFLQYSTSERYWEMNSTTSRMNWYLGGGWWRERGEERGGGCVCYLRVVGWGCGGSSATV